MSDVAAATNSADLFAGLTGRSVDHSRCRSRCRWHSRFRWRVGASDPETRSQCRSILKSRAPFFHFTCKRGVEIRDHLAKEPTCCLLLGGSQAVGELAMEGISQVPEA